MREAVGTKTTYFITQFNTETKVEEFIEYNAYTGSFMTGGNVDGVTRFESREQAVDLAKLQIQIAKLLKRPFTYRVVEEVISRSEAYSEIEVEEVEVDNTGE